jgi:hypothetical protein
MKYQVQFKNNTLTFPSIIWLRDFLVKRKGDQNAHTIASMVQSGKMYRDTEIKIIMIKGD